MKTTIKITLTAVGIAMYVVLSMSAKIPVIAHISLDLGYIVLAVYCYHMGAVSGMIVGGAGCVLVSMLTTGWFPPGWFVGNLLVGLMCGLLYHRRGGVVETIVNVSITVAAVTIGIFGMKTIIECAMYGIPYAVKLPKNGVACVMDTAVMSAGLLFAQHGPIVKLWARYRMGART
ncbi:MAG: ECF transporter S component [Bacteroidales bacterium]|nr:ECF transporter S component [Bacteroidales bacterium]